ncbi:MAG: HD domain-containing protein [Lachnospiraceae bacterium]|nr:HD domain-containing protein [Lachnospiraceae bacterium]
MGVNERYFEQNERNVNRFLLCCMGVLTLLGPGLALLRRFHWDGVSLAECAYIFAYTLGMLLLALGLERLARWRGVTKYVLTLGIHLLICYISTKDGMNLNIAYALVPALSCLYYDRRFTLYITEICYAVLIVTIYIRSYTEVMVSYPDLKPIEWFVSFAFWSTVEFMMLAVILYLLVSKIHQTLLTLQKQNAAMLEMQNQLVTGFSNLVESRDKSTGEHVLRTREYVRMIAEELKRQGHYVDELSPETIRKYAMAAPLHDTGKLAVPDAILHKEGSLTEEEYEIIKKHTTEGYRLVTENLSNLGDAELLQAIQHTVLYHHERWDGSGYPEGRRGTDIPLCARIMAAADALDALLSERCYKKSMEVEEAFAVFEEQKGSYFEPCIVDAVLELKKPITDFLHR